MKESYTIITTAFIIIGTCFIVWYAIIISCFEQVVGKCEPEKEGGEEDRELHGGIGVCAGLGRLFVRVVGWNLGHRGGGGGLYTILW